MEQEHNNLEKIKEINWHISDALKKWSDIVTLADADQWSYFLDYSDEDMLNALFIFNHVWQNRAIKRGVFDKENAGEKMERFKNVVMDVFDIDTIELTSKVIGLKKGENNNGSKDCKD